MACNYHTSPKTLHPTETREEKRKFIKKRQLISQPHEAAQKPALYALVLYKKRWGLMTGEELLEIGRCLELLEGTKVYQLRGGRYLKLNGHHFF